MKDLRLHTKMEYKQLLQNASPLHLSDNSNPDFNKLPTCRLLTSVLESWFLNHRNYHLLAHNDQSLRISEETLQYLTESKQNPLQPKQHNSLLPDPSRSGN